MMTCDKCGEDTYVIFITSKHEKVCDKCWDEEKKKKELPEFPDRE
jgi:hypothetical protein